METEPSNTLSLPHQPWERAPVGKLKEGDDGGGTEAEEWEGERLTVSGTGLGCSEKAQHKRSIQGIRNQTVRRKKQDNPPLPAFFLTTVQISLSLLPPIHLLSGSNTLSVCTYHTIKGILTISSIDHTSQGLFIARKRADYSKQIV